MFISRKNIISHMSHQQLLLNVWTVLKAQQGRSPETLSIRCLSDHRKGDPDSSQIKHTPAPEGPSLCVRMITQAHTPFCPL